MMSIRQATKGKRPIRNNNAVEMQEKRFGYFPKAFRWHGKRYDVRVVERCWTKLARSPRLCFRVRCEEGTFELYQDVQTNTWHLMNPAWAAKLERWVV